MRLALGSGRLRLASQLFLEGLVLATVATLLAVPLAWAGIGMSRASIPPAIVRFIPGWQYLTLSVPVRSARPAPPAFLPAVSTRPAI